LLVFCILLNTGLVFWVHSSVTTVNEQYNTSEAPVVEGFDGLRYALRFLHAVQVCNFVMALITVPRLCFSLANVFGEMGENRNFHVVALIPLSMFLWRHRKLENIVFCHAIIRVGQAACASMFPTVATLFCFVITSFGAVIALPAFISAFTHTMLQLLKYLVEIPTDSVEK